MLDIKTRVKEIHGIDPNNIPPEVLSSNQPLILKGLASKWPLAQAGLVSDEDAISYLRSFYEDKTVGTFFGSPENDGFYYYNEDLSGFNYRRERVRLDEVLNLKLHNGK